MDNNNTKKEKKSYIPYQLKDNGFIKLKDANFNDFNSIISQIEDSEIAYLNKQSSQKNENITSVGIDKDSQEKIKINGYKGEKLVNFYDNIVEKINDLVDKVNEHTQYYTGTLSEKDNKDLVKSLLKIRNKNQPSCRDSKFKTSWFFSSAFSEKLTSDNGLEILNEMYKDLEICMKFMLSIIKEFCTKTGIINPRLSVTKFDLNLLMNKEKSYHSNKTEQQRKIKEEEEKRRLYQQQYQQHRMYYGGKKNKRTKKIKRI